MAPKSVHVVVLAFLCLVAVTASLSLRGWKEIENPNDDEMVVKVAKFAVEEHNKEKNKSVVLVSVLKGETQVAAGITYKLVVACKDGKYRTQVWSKPDGTLDLGSFHREILI